MTHIVRGKIDIIWKQGGVMLAYLKKDWEEREKLRSKAEQSTVMYN